ncbi:MAG: UbiA family prenyltransferase, partial [Bacteroidales bacterium]
HHVSFNYLFAWVAGFSFFAFLSTLIRELIKDAEDFEGDSAYGMKTVPIVLGSGWTKAIVVGLIIFTLAVLIFLLLKFILFSVEPADYYSLVYFIVLLIIPFILLAFNVIRAKNKRDYHRASTLIKLIMLFGILYSVLVFYLVNFKY